MHVIVGQGQLDSVLHADPMGRRAFIEEAAGVLKHRKRKEKAVRKLDAMGANLARVQDLTDELRRQLKPLGRQAAVARRAAVIQADLRDARLRLLADDLVTLRDALRDEIADEAELKKRKEAAEAELRTALAREAELEGEVRRLAPRLQRAQQTWYELSQLAERVRGTVSLADARVRSASEAPTEERRGRDPEDMEREAARIREQEAELTAALEAAEHALEDTVAHRADLERELAVEERRLKDVARAIADRREGLARLNGQVNAARSRAGSAQAEIDRLAAARDEARERAASAQEEYEQLKAEVDGLDAGDEELAARHEAAKEALAEARSAHSETREEATAAERRTCGGGGPARGAGPGAAPQGRHRRAARGPGPARRSPRPGRRTAHRRARLRGPGRRRPRRGGGRGRRHGPGHGRRRDPAAARAGRGACGHAAGRRGGRRPDRRGRPGRGGARARRSSRACGVVRACRSARPGLGGARARGARRARRPRPRCGGARARRDGFVRPAPPRTGAARRTGARTGRGLVRSGRRGGTAGAGRRSRRDRFRRTSRDRGRHHHHGHRPCRTRRPSAWCAGPPRSSVPYAVSYRTRLSSRPWRTPRRWSPRTPG